MYTVFNFEWKVPTLNVVNFKKLQNYLKALSFDTRNALPYFSLLTRVKAPNGGGGGGGNPAK